MKPKLPLLTPGALRNKAGILKLQMILVFLIMVCGKAWALNADEFDGLKCGADVPKFLVGKRSPNKRVGDVEQRHKDLGLKDLGGTEISDRLFLTSWRICGNEYEVLLNTKTGLIRDVLPFPAHSATSPQYVGACQAGGKQVRDVVAVLNNSAGQNARDKKAAKTMLKATAAWTIDQTKEKFVKHSVENLTCPLDGISSIDGGP